MRLRRYVDLILQIPNLVAISFQRGGWFIFYAI
jgi:hypothetical protein